MDFIDSQKNMFDELIRIYQEDNFLEEIELKKDQIIRVFNQIFDDEALNFDLVYKNAIQNGKYYKIESRIKKPESLREKFYRRNIGLELIRDLNLTPERISRHEVQIQVKEAYSLLDDVIGIRIITELKADCISALSLIENRMSLFNQGGIFFQTDFKTQPVMMENGHGIIKLKGIYGGKNAFELQIKSKIDSAWGDIDHKLFYKDYRSTPMKDSLQVSMNNIGELLNHIEKFLYDLRETTNDSDDRYHNQRLVDDLFETLSPAIDSKLNIKYDLKRILEPILFFCKELNIGDSLGVVDFSYFEAIKIFDEYPSYASIRKYNFDYVLLEIIFVHCHLVAENSGIKDIDINHVLKHYFMNLCKYMAKKLKESDMKLEHDYYKVLYKKMLLLLTYVEDPNILFDYQTYKKIRLIDKIIIDVIVENEMDIEAEKISEVFTVFAFGKGRMIHQYAYDDDEDYIEILTKVKMQVKAIDYQELMDFYNQVFLKIAKDIEYREES